MRTAIYTGLALVAFAANSVLCRMALGAEAIDATTFFTVRIAAGAATLVVAAALAGGRVSGGSWTSALILFVYGIPFSVAYTHLTAGTGALILFGSVQITMLAVAVARHEAMRPAHWAGIALALAGLVYLTRPGLAAPAPSSALLMAVAGMCWGAYSLRGRATTRPVAETAGNFLRLLPLVLTVTAFMAVKSRVHATTNGVALAALSGSVASGLGYVVWYRALRGLTRTRAAVVQLAVPVIALAGGALALGEVVTAQVAIAAAMILGGIAVTIAGR